MRMLALSLAICAGLPTGFVFGQVAAPRSTAPQPAAAQPASDEAAIRKVVSVYVDAFNARDAKTLAAQWSPEAVYVNRITGEEVVGRAAIAGQFEALFKSMKDVKLDVKVESIRFLSPNVAVEQGTATYLVGKGEPDSIEYSAVYVKRDGGWLLDRVTDSAPDAATSHYDQLKVLEWMVGRWIDQDDNVRIETECKWAKNQNYLVRSYSVESAGVVQMSGMQVIGWDAAAKSIRSWAFDSDGGFAEATWSRKGDKWFIKNSGVLADGRKASMVNVIKMVDANSFTWQTIERTAGGEVLPNIGEVKIVRQ